MINYFQKIVGEENVADDDFTKLVYSTDASRIKGSTNFVAWPLNAEQLHLIILFARRNKAKLMLRGAGTNIMGGSVPKNHIIIDMSRMNNIVSVNSIEETAVVDAGVNIADLNKRMDRLMFPVLPYTYKASTIGGLIAKDAFTPRLKEKNRIHDWILALDVIDGTGRHWRVEGQQMRDFCGKEGITGAILRAKIKLVKKPAFRTMTIHKFDYLEELIEIIPNLEDAQAIEYIDKNVSKLIGWEPAYYLISDHYNNKGSITDINEIERIWDTIDGLPVLLSNKDYVNEDPHVPKESLSKILQWLNLEKVPTFAHLSSGIIHPAFSANDPKLKLMHEKVRQLNGRLNTIYGTGILRKNVVEGTYYKMLLDKYNPDKILNSGVLC